MYEAGSTKLNQLYIIFSLVFFFMTVPPKELGCALHYRIMSRTGSLDKFMDEIDIDYQGLSDLINSKMLTAPGILVRYLI